MDEDFDGLYHNERRMGQVFIAATLLAIIVACLGLLGLAAYAAEQRTREISIRKAVLAAGFCVSNKYSHMDNGSGGTRRGDGGSAGHRLPIAEGSEGESGGEPADGVKKFRNLPVIKPYLHDQGRRCIA
ncbi:MAG TPA: hypothetical protein VGM31_23040 [Puia sp.]|jgi:hypothetical protein